MSAAFIWIILPILLGLVAIMFRRWGAALFLASAAFTIFLAWIAWQIPINVALELGPITLKISASLNVLGRSFNILDAERPLIALIYLAATLCFLGGYLAKPGSLFAGLALIIVALLVAALSVEPFLYAALLIAIAILLSVPLLAPPGKSPGPGLLRFVTLQLFGVPFILFVGWLLTGVEASPSNFDLVLRAGLLVGLGFAFLQAVFPFHSWIPMLAEESHPYVVGFILLFLPFAVSLFGLSFVDRYAWLRETDLVFQLLMAVGALVCFLGGAWAAIQTHLGRQMGYAMVFEIGVALLALGLSGAEAVQLTFALFIPRMIALLVWAVALSGLREASGGSLDFNSVGCTVRNHPILFASVLMALFSFAGLPFLAGFAPKIALFTRVWQRVPWMAAAALLGSFALVIAGLRTLFTLSLPAVSDQLHIGEESLLGSARDEALPDISNPYAWLFLLIGGGSLLLLALFPQLLIGDLASFLTIFPQLSP